MRKARILVIIFSAFLSYAGFYAAFNGHNPPANLLMAFVFLAIIIFLLVKPLMKKSVAQSTKSYLSRDDFSETLPSQEELPPDPEALVEVQFHQSDPDEDLPAPRGALFSFLDAQALHFWDGKRTDFEIPPYYAESAFGRNVLPALDRLIQGGYLQRGNLEKSISLQKVPELKAILAEKELKVSGKKSELVHRLMDNIPREELESLFPVGVYTITEKGELALKPYSIVFANNTYHLGFSNYRLLQEKEKTPDASDEDILIRVFSEDIQQCYKEHAVDRYQRVMQQVSAFMRMIGQPEKSLQCEILTFFIWSRQVDQFPISNDSSAYYMSMNIEREAEACGYSLEQLLALFEKTLKDTNPFGLASDHNVQDAISIFKNSLSVK